MSFFDNIEISKTQIVYKCTGNEQINWNKKIHLSSYFEIYRKNGYKKVFLQIMDKKILIFSVS